MTVALLAQLGHITASTHEKKKKQTKLVNGDSKSMKLKKDHETGVRSHCSLLLSVCRTVLESTSKVSPV